MDMVFMLVSSTLLLGVIAFTIVLELDNIKRNKNANTKTWDGWSINERD
jgi:hypothetical protein